MALNTRLEHYFNDYREEDEEAIEDTLFEDSEDLIESLEQLAEWDLSEEISMEEGIFTKFKDKFKDFKREVRDLYRTSSKNIKSYRKKLEALREKVDAKEMDEDKSVSLNNIAGYIYSKEQGNYREDVRRAILEDIDFIEEVHKLNDTCLKYLKENVSLYAELRDASNIDEFEELVKKKFPGKLKGAGSALRGSNVPSDNLYGTYLEMAKGFDDSLKGDEFATQSQPIKFRRGVPKEESKQRARLTENVRLSQKDILDLLDALIRYADTALETEDYLNETERGIKDSLEGMINVDVSFPKKIIVLNAKRAKGALEPMISVNQSLMRTGHTLLPMMLARNIRVLRKLTAFSEKLA